MDSPIFAPVTVEHAEFLYALLQERDPAANISHKRMPTFEDHVRFIESNPYAAWYVPELGGKPIGSVYITSRDEVGLFLARDYQGKGLGKIILSHFMLIEPRKHYYANIAPLNEVSKRFFQKFGFRPIQHTYELEAR